jgi:hypothetical protein
MSVLAVAPLVSGVGALVSGVGVVSSAAPVSAVAVVSSLMAVVSSPVEVVSSLVAVVSSGAVSPPLAVSVGVETHAPASHAPAPQSAINETLLPQASTRQASPPLHPSDWLGRQTPVSQVWSARQSALEMQGLLHQPASPLPCHA